MGVPRLQRISAVGEESSDTVGIKEGGGTGLIVRDGGNGALHFFLFPYDRHGRALLWQDGSAQAWAV